MMKSHRKRAHNRNTEEKKQYKILFGKYECILALTVFTLLTVVGSTFHIALRCGHDLHDHEEMPNIIQKTQNIKGEWEALNHYSLTLVENMPGVKSCPEMFVPMKSEEECRIAAFHLQREFIASKGRGPCVLRPHANPPSIAYESDDPNQDRYICKKILHQTSELSYISLIGDCPGEDIEQLEGLNLEKCQEACTKKVDCKGITFKNMRCWLKASRCDMNPGPCDNKKEFCFYVKPRDTMHNSENLLETDTLERKEKMLEQKAEKRRKARERELKSEQEQASKRRRRELDAKIQAEQDPGKASDEYEYLGNGWCTNENGNRIKLRKMHWHIKPIRDDHSMEFCEKLCDSDPICGGYVSSASEDKAEHQCDIINALDDQYDTGIKGIYCLKCNDVTADKDHRHCFKRKREPKLPAQPLIVPKPDPNADGVRLASRFNRKCRDMWPVKHWTDAVGSTTRGIVFIDNVKAGSSSIRRKLGMIWAGSFTEEIPIKNPDARFQCDRMSTGVWDSTDISELGVSIFSWVRDPVSKFESGVRQAWHHDPTMQEYSADEMLDIILGHPLEETNSIPAKHCGPPFNREYGWLNEHLQPSSWRLTGETNDGKHLEYDFIGKLEDFDRDWNEMLKRVILEPSEVYMVPILTDMWVKNKKEAVDRSRLSPESIRKMCNSERYGREWECFDYPLPKECQ